MSGSVPQLRNLLRKQVGTDITTGVVLGCIFAAGWYYGVQLPRKRRYEAFYKNYDAVKDAESYKPSWEQ